MMDAVKPQGCTNLKLRQLSRAVTRHYDAYVAPTGLKNSQYSLLSHVVLLGPLRPTDLAARMKIDASTLTRNLHPLVAFDPRQPGIIEKVRAASSDILHKCVELGGTITGEHGVGLEKQDFMPWLFSEADLRPMRTLKSVFDPTGQLNPGKIFPGAHRSMRP